MRLAFLQDAKRDQGVERLKSLRRFAEDRLKPDLEAVEGSAAVKVSGGYEDEVQIFVDQQKLAQLGLSIETVTRRIRAENVNLSGGRLEACHRAHPNPSARRHPAPAQTPAGLGYEPQPAVGPVRAPAPDARTDRIAHSTSFVSSR